MTGNAAAQSSFGNRVYNTLVRRNSVFIGAIFISGLGFALAFDSLSNRLWARVNKGVCISSAEYYSNAMYVASMGRH